MNHCVSGMLGLVLGLRRMRGHPIGGRGRGCPTRTRLGLDTTATC